jgi:pimeloyl-ACP methyl ester carboxylesterase
MAEGGAGTLLKLLRWSVRLSLVLVALVVALAIAGAIYQTAGQSRDSHRFPQRGKSVRAGSIQLNIDCAGEGAPTVILESGFEVPAIGWMKVQPEVARFARVCSYDRAGYGWSDAGPEPRTSAQIATELKALLNAAGEKGPFVLVGHSFGGYNVRVYTGRYPGDVAGVVLVDAAHEDWERRFDAVLSAETRETIKWVDRFEKGSEAYLTRFGILRLCLATGVGVPRVAGKDFLREMLYLNGQTKAIRAFAGEHLAFGESGDQARAAGKLGDRPLIVLTAGNRADPVLERILSTDEMSRQAKLWIDELQPEQARLSTRGKQVIVPDSGHMIPLERPDAVVAAIREVWLPAR